MSRRGFTPVTRRDLLRTAVGFAGLSAAHREPHAKRPVHANPLFVGQAHLFSQWEIPLRRRDRTRRQS